MKHHKSPKADIFSQYSCTVTAADTGTICLNKERVFRLLTAVAVIASL